MRKLREGESVGRKRLMQHDHRPREGVDKDKYAEGYEAIFGAPVLPNRNVERHIISQKSMCSGDTELLWSDGEREVLPCPEEKRDARRHTPFPEISDTYTPA